MTDASWFNPNERMVEMDVLSNHVTCLESWDISNPIDSNDDVKSAKRRRRSVLPCSVQVPPVYSAAKNCLIAVNNNGVDLNVIDLRKKSADAKVRGHDNEITSLAIFDDLNCVISGGYDSVLKHWKLDVNSHSSITLKLVTEITLTNVICKVIAHPARQLILVWLESNLIKLKHLNHIAAEEVSIHVQDSNVTSITQNHDQIVYGTDKGKIYVWSYEVTSNPVYKLDTGEGSVFLLDVMESILASWTTKQRHINIWNIRSRERLRQVCTSPCPSYIAITTDCKHVLYTDTKRHLHLESLTTDGTSHDLVSFDSPVIMSSPFAPTQHFWLVLRSWEVLKLQYTAGVLEKKDATDSPERSSSVACVIL